MSTSRDELRLLADKLPEDVAAEVLDFALYVQERRRRDALLPVGLRNASIDDEPTSPEEDVEAEEARASYRAQGGIGLDALLSERDELAD